jgi:DNA-binding Lrp family transcriptional regulator
MVWRDIMKNSDLLFLSFLRQDARRTLTDISKKTRIPISTLYDKLKCQEKDLIMKHTTLIDFAKLGFNCRAKILLSTSRDEKDKLKNYLNEHPCINSLFKINNGFDFLAEGIFLNIKELEEFMENIEQKFRISEKKTFYVIEDVKRECFMARPEQLDRVMMIQE